MRNALSPILQEIERRIHAAHPDARFTRNVAGDTLLVTLKRSSFSFAPAPGRSHDTVADWPIYATPIPPPDENNWVCRRVDDALEALKWPDSIPRLDVISAAELLKMFKG